MTVQVRLFAILRERAGCDSLEIELGEGATVAEAIERLSAREPLAELLRADAVAPRGQSRPTPSPRRRCSAEDELALVPPISGGAGPHVRVTEEPLSAAELTAAVADSRAGAVVSFQGVTREVERLDYEAYREMAEERIAAILDECIGRHELLGAAAEHRVGPVRARRAGGDRRRLRRPSRGSVRRGAARRSTGSRPRRRSGSARSTARAGRAGSRAPRRRSTALRPRARRRERASASPTWARTAGRGWSTSAPSPTTERGPAPGRGCGCRRATARAVAAGGGPKGEVLGVARFAGIQAAKQTAALIPLAHPIALSFVDVSADVDEGGAWSSWSPRRAPTAQTGVEMEAMTACAVAALTVYDMVKGIERGVEIEQVVLLEKSGGVGLAARGRGGLRPQCARRSSPSAPRRRGARARTRAVRAWPSWHDRLGAEIAGRDLDSRRPGPDRRAAAPLGRRRGLRAGADHRRHRLLAPPT